MFSISYTRIFIFYLVVFYSGCDVHDKKAQDTKKPEALTQNQPINMESIENISTEKIHAKLPDFFSSINKRLEKPQAVQIIKSPTELRIKFASDTADSEIFAQLLGKFESEAGLTISKKNGVPEEFVFDAQMALKFFNEIVAAKPNSKRSESASGKATTELKAAQDLINQFVSNPNNRKLKEVQVLWIPSQESFDAFLSSGEKDRSKEYVINQLRQQLGKKITKALAFYDIRDPGAAFANTYEGTKEFEYKGVKSKIAELLFQAEKLVKFGLPPFRGNRQASYDQIIKEKGKQGFGTFVHGFRNTPSIKRGAFNAAEWDKQSVDLFSAIQAQRFKVEPDLFLALVSTPSRSIIIENAKGKDKNWGNGPDGKGQNLLGLLYMTHRQRFWEAFKKAHNRVFNFSNPDDVAFMLKWLKDYNG